MNDNPLNFNTDPNPFWDEPKNTKEEKKMKYDEVIPKNAQWHDQSCRFTIDWLKNIIDESKKAKSKQKRGMPYRRALRAWGKWYGENDLAEIARCARKIMDEVRKQHPEVANFL